MSKLMQKVSRLKRHKATAIAPANIAFIKYWGRVNEELRLPANSSISMNLSEAYSETTVEFNKKFKKDVVMFKGKRMLFSEANRVIKHLDRIRALAGLNLKAKVETRNSFPKGTGIASSASGFAALTLAASKAAGLTLNKKDLSILARLGSGSACRSIPDGIVEWKKGKTSKKSYAVSLFPASYWDLRDIIVVVGARSKKVGSTEGHAVAESSPFYKERIRGMEKKIKSIKKAIKNKNFKRFGEILEAEAINMHMVMMTSEPPLFYWLPKTLKVMQFVIKQREKGVKSYFTIDAGPNVHIICQAKNAQKIVRELKRMEGIKNILVCKPSNGAFFT